MVFQKWAQLSCIPKLGAVSIGELQPHQVQRFINNLASGSKPLSPKTIKNIHGILHRALEKAVQIRYVQSNPADGCNLPRIEKKEMNYLADKQLITFLQAAKGHRFEYMFIVAMFTGMRQGELLGLCWDSIDWEHGTIRVKRQLQLIKGEYKLVATKNSKPRTISPPQYVLSILRAQQKIQLE